MKRLPIIAAVLLVIASLGTAVHFLRLSLELSQYASDLLARIDQLEESLRIAPTPETLQTLQEENALLAREKTALTEEKNTLSAHLAEERLRPHANDVSPSSPLQPAMSPAPEKDKPAAALASDIESLKNDLLQAQSALAKSEDTIKSLRAELDATAGELAQTQLGDPNSLPSQKDPSTNNPNAPSQAAQPDHPLDPASRELAEQAKKHFAAGQFDEAEALYRKIVAAAPENFFALTNLAVTQIQTQKLAAAEIALKKALTLHPSDSFAQTHLAIVHCKRGQFDLAFSLLKDTLEKDASNPVAQNYLGVCLAETGKKDDARQAFDRSIALQDAYPDAHFNLAVLLATQTPPDLKSARNHYLKALANGAPPDADLERTFQ